MNYCGGYLKIEVGSYFGFGSRIMGDSSINNSHIFLTGEF